MVINTRVIWSVRRLSKEFGLSKTKITKILMSIGAKKWSGGHYYYDSEE